MNRRLEKALEGMAVGDTKQVMVTPTEGFGPLDPDALQEVEKQRLPPEALHVGAQLTGKLPDGRTVYPRVAAIKTDAVVLDFNHPLAGLPSSVPLHSATPRTCPQP